MRKLLWLILLLAFTMLIFLSSSLPMSESGRISGTAASLLQELWHAAGIEQADNLEHLLRKLTHFMAFAIQGWLLYKTFAAFHAGTSANGYILLAGLLTAVVDEYIQSFSTGRSSSVNDVLLDFSGAFCMWLSCRIWQWSWH